MAKFRRNHTKSGNFLSSSFLRIVAFLFIGAFAIYYLTRTVEESDLGDYEVPVSMGEMDRYFLPKGAKGQIVDHLHYTLSYNEKYEQADWVAYELTKASIKLPNVKRAKNFKPDYSVDTGSAFHRDYSHSGYTRGHLAPAGDMAFSIEAMQESFFMSNMSPQLEAFNGGVWRELEETVRDWAYDNDRIFVVTGPILKEGIKKRIGDNGVGVPHRFFKLVLDISGKEKKGLGFVIANELQEAHLKEFAVSIDSIESLTGFDFFDDLMDEELEREVEGEIDLGKWRFDEKRFQHRNNRYR